MYPSISVLNAQVYKNVSLIWTGIFQHDQIVAENSSHLGKDSQFGI